eukprot:2410099-Rhodomonas_salina.3
MAVAAGNVSLVHSEVGTSLWPYASARRCPVLTYSRPYAMWGTALGLCYGDTATADIGRAAT